MNQPRRKLEGPGSEERMARLRGRFQSISRTLPRSRKSILGIIAIGVLIVFALLYVFGDFFAV